MPRPLFDPATDYYSLLGLSARATTAEIRAAYRALAKTHHPDLHAGSSRAAARMARLNVAKAVLLDPATRTAYDAARRARFVGGGGYAAPVGARPHPAAVRSTIHAAPVRPAAAGPGATAPPRRSTTHVQRLLDPATLILLGFAFSAIFGLVLYLAGGMQAAGRPRPGVAFDLALSPSTTQSAQNTAQLAFALVGGRPPDSRTARYVNDVVQNLKDLSPEASALRDASRRLVDAARRNDAQAWQRAVADVCALAGHC